ncbi:uncharacterized protein LOC111618420 [Centruroides sculpturatus]|uniref:uncharacterized protein LOC111618420 n=1 Tax=Centruroides sculpturatus TaxID=218467 RepID=UPI000C6D6BC5|nr:uncharacterized protein LOC111618420 [Centruroides sculpturatus]
MAEKSTLDFEGLNLENGELKCFYDGKKDKNIILQEKMVMTAGKDVERRHAALRRATLLKQKVISTELKLDGLKKHEVINRSGNEHYYETRVDELNTKLNNYTGALEKENERISSDLLNNDLMISVINKRRSVAIGEKLNCQNHLLCDMEDTGKSKKNPLRVIGHFLDVKLRGHKRVKSDEYKGPESGQMIRPRTLTNPFYFNKGENGSLSKNGERLGVEKVSLRTEIDPAALAEIEAFEKFIEDYFDRHCCCPI